MSAAHTISSEQWGLDSPVASVFASHVWTANGGPFQSKNRTIAGGSRAILDAKMSTTQWITFCSNLGLLQLGADIPLLQSTYNANKDARSGGLHYPGFLAAVQELEGNLGVNILPRIAAAKVVPPPPPPPPPPGVHHHHHTTYVDQLPVPWMEDVIARLALLEARPLAPPATDLSGIMSQLEALNDQMHDVLDVQNASDQRAAKTQRQLAELKASLAAAQKQAETAEAEAAELRKQLDVVSKRTEQAAAAAQVRVGTSEERLSMLEAAQAGILAPLQAVKVGAQESIKHLDGKLDAVTAALNEEAEAARRALEARIAAEAEAARKQMDARIAAAVAEGVESAVRQAEMRAVKAVTASTAGVRDETNVALEDLATRIGKVDVDMAACIEALKAETAATNARIDSLRSETGLSHQVLRDKLEEFKVEATERMNAAEESSDAILKQATLQTSTTLTSTLGELSSSLNSMQPHITYLIDRVAVLESFTGAPSPPPELPQPPPLQSAPAATHLTKRIQKMTNKIQAAKVRPRSATARSSRATSLRDPEEDVETAAVMDRTASLEAQMAALAVRTGTLEVAKAEAQYTIRDLDEGLRALSLSRQDSLLEARHRMDVGLAGRVKLLEDMIVRIAAQTAPAPETATKAELEAMSQELSTCVADLEARLEVALRALEGLGSDNGDTESNMSDLQAFQVPPTNHSNYSTAPVNDRNSPPDSNYSTAPVSGRNSPPDSNSPPRTPMPDGSSSNPPSEIQQMMAATNTRRSRAAPVIPTVVVCGPGASSVSVDLPPGVAGTSATARPQSGMEGGGAASLYVSVDGSTHRWDPSRQPGTGGIRRNASVKETDHGSRLLHQAKRVNFNPESVAKAEAADVRKRVAEIKARMQSGGMSSKDMSKIKKQMSKLADRVASLERLTALKDQLTAIVGVLEILDKRQKEAKGRLGTLETEVMPKIEAVWQKLDGLEALSELKQYGELIMEQRLQSGAMQVIKERLDALEAPLKGPTDMLAELHTLMAASKDRIDEMQRQMAQERAANLERQSTLERRVMAERQQAALEKALAGHAAMVAAAAGGVEGAMSTSEATIESGGSGGGGRGLTPMGSRRLSDAGSMTSGGAGPLQPSRPSLSTSQASSRRPTLMDSVPVPGVPGVPAVPGVLQPHVNGGMLNGVSQRQLEQVKDALNKRIDKLERRVGMLGATMGVGEATMGLSGGGNGTGGNGGAGSYLSVGANSMRTAGEALNSRQRQRI